VIILCVEFLCFGFFYSSFLLLLHLPQSNHPSKHNKLSMAKKKSSKPDERDIETELQGLIEQNQNLTKGMKKIIESMEKKKTNQ